jgi:hypothetical protein
MAIGTGTPGEDFSARVIFSAPGIVPQQWAVTHEFSTNILGPEDAEWQAFADRMAAFHIALLATAFTLERIVISTLAEDSAPYDPTRLGVFEYAEFGTRVGTGDIVPLVNCLLVKRVVSNGRLGNMLLRGMLQEGDLNSPGGIPGLTDKAGLQTEVQNALTATEFDFYLSAAAENIQLYMITKGLIDNTERAVNSFLVQGLTAKKLNNKYFDKGIL